MKWQGSFPKGKLTAQSCWLVQHAAEQQQKHCKDSSRNSKAFERLSLSSQTRWHNSTRSGFVLRPGWFRCSQTGNCGYKPSSRTLPSVYAHSWTPAASSSADGKWANWALGAQLIWNKSLTPLIYSKGRTLYFAQPQLHGTFLTTAFCFNYTGFLYVN